jgi:hypothetical protein
LGVTLRNRVQVFELKEAEASALLMPVDSEQGAFLSQLAGKPIDLTAWPPIVVDLPADRTSGTDLTDLAWSWTEPAFTLHAANALALLLRGNCQLLPLRSLKGDYHICNALLADDALDEAASTVQRYSSGRIMSISRYVFRAPIVAARPLFKIAQLPKAHTFVTDVFVEAVGRHRLTGFAPRLLWDSTVPSPAA